MSQDKPISREQRLLELICAEIDADERDDNAVEMLLWQSDIERAGLRFNEAVVVLKDFQKQKLLFEVATAQRLREFDDPMGNNELYPEWQVRLITWPGIRESLDEFWIGEKKNTPATYDASGGVLHLMSQNIPISERSSKTKSQYVVEYLFSKSNPAEQHFYSEIAQELFADEEHDPRAYYRACEAVNAKVLKATGIKDFLIFSSGIKGSVRVNPSFVA